MLAVLPGLLVAVSPIAVPAQADAAGRFRLGDGNRYGDQRAHRLRHRARDRLIGAVA
jgi:hypothetical protein